MIESHRIGLFLLLCIPLRLALVYWAIMIHSQKNKDWSRTRYILDGFCLIIGISFIYQFFRGNTIGFSGGKVWWGNLRIIHAINYLTYVIMSYYELNYAYVPLLFDVLIGLLGFGYNRINIDGWKWIVNNGGLVKPIVNN